MFCYQNELPPLQVVWVSHTFYDEKKKMKSHDFRVSGGHIIQASCLIATAGLGSFFFFLALGVVVRAEEGTRGWFTYTFDLVDIIYKPC